MKLIIKSGTLGFDCIRMCCRYPGDDVRIKHEWVHFRQTGILHFWGCGEKLSARLTMLFYLVGGKSTSFICLSQKASVALLLVVVSVFVMRRRGSLWIKFLKNKNPTPGDYPLNFGLVLNHISQTCKPLTYPYSCVSTLRWRKGAAVKLLFSSYTNTMELNLCITVPD